MSTVRLKLVATKKHSGKYVVIGTEKDVFPVYLYIRREWVRGENQPLPANVLLTITPQD
jgi:hypothetical protein